MHRVLFLLLNYFSLQEVTSQMNVDRKVGSLLVRECNGVFDCHPILYDGNSKGNWNFSLRLTQKQDGRSGFFSEINS